MVIPTMGSAGNADGAVMRRQHGAGGAATRGGEHRAQAAGLAA